MIIDGKKIAEEIQNEIATTLSVSSFDRQPCLAMILVGNDPASEIYVTKKTSSCHQVGLKSLNFRLTETIEEQELIRLIHTLNQDDTVDGILVQFPLPSHINSMNVLLNISPEKDVDGFHPLNVGKLFSGEKDGFVPCTPLGIKVLLDKHHITTEGKHVVVMGRSNIVGKPMAALLMQNEKDANATVTVVHSKTKNLAEITKTADILIAAIGKPLFVKREMVKKEAVVIDVGINKIIDSSKKSGFRLVGDVDFKEVETLASYITPVPGGVGPMTIAMLLSNTLNSFLKRTCQTLND